MKLIISKIKKAQTFLEYSTLIMIVAGALIAMRLFYSRSLQGHYREYVNRLGGERINEKIFMPAIGYTTDGHSYKQSSSWSFSYEHGIGIGFGISSGGFSAISQSKMSGITPSYTSIKPKVEPLLDGGEDKTFFEKFNTHLTNPEEKAKEIDDSLAQSLEGEFKTIHNKYTPKDEAIIKENPDYYTEEKNYARVEKEKVSEIKEKNSLYAQNEGYFEEEDVLEDKN